jgi:ParB family chromosome partitioning protein
VSRGGITDWDSLLSDVGSNSPVDGAANATRAPAPTKAVPLDQLVANPYNPRDSLGDLADLASIVDHQLQPAIAVTRATFLGLFPDAEVAAKWVVIIGNRRLAAARKFGRPTLDIIVKDDLARDRATLLSAVISENVDRKGFDVIEEAKAVERLVAEYGSAEAAKESLKKSSTWITQRRALLKLDPVLQDALRRGDLPVREGRELAKLSHAEQVEFWKSRTDAGSGGADHHSSRRSSPGEGSASPGAPRARSLSRALRRFDTDPAALAGALYDELGETRVKTLVSQLRKRLRP